jgi:primosomal protein N'
MSAFSCLKRVLSVGQGTTTVVECRHCGTPLQSDADACGECGSGEIAHYEL